MAFSTFEIKICGQKLCAQMDGFHKSGHILCYYALIFHIKWLHNNSSTH